MESMISKYARGATMLTAFAFVVTACSQDSATAPGIAVDGQPTVTEKLGGQQGPAPRHEKVKACLDSTSIVTSTVVEVVVDQGNNGTTDQVNRYPITSGSCLLVWMHGGPTLDAVRVDIAAPNNNPSHIDMDIVDGVTSTSAPATGNRSDGNLVNGTHGATVVFNIQ